MTKKRVKCTWPGCDKDYADKRGMQQHVNAVHLKIKILCGKTLTNGTKCEHFEYYRSNIDEHRKICGIEMICKICGVSFTTAKGYLKHLKSHPKQGTSTKYSLALENVMKGDKPTIEAAEKLTAKQFKKYKKEVGTKNSGVYTIGFPRDSTQSSLEDFLDDQKYVGKNADPNGNSRRTGHHSNMETNDALITFYNECRTTSSQPIYYLPFADLPSTAAKEIENAMILAYGAHNLCNVNSGSPNEDLDLDEVALFGSWLWREAFKRFKEFDFADAKNRLDVSRERKNRVKAVVDSRKRPADMKVVSKNDAIDSLLAEVERLKSLEVKEFQQMFSIEKVFAPIDSGEPKLKISK